MDDDGDARVNSDGQVWCGDCSIRADLDEAEHDRADTGFFHDTYEDLK
jgi:hypothetical protein